MAQGPITQPESCTRTPGRNLLPVLGGLFIASFFLFFTWRGLLIYFTGDDMFNLYG